MNEQQVRQIVQDMIQNQNSYSQFNMTKIVSHRHTGSDVDKIEWKNLSNRKIYVTQTLPGTTASTVADYGVFFIVPTACYLTSVKVSFEAASTSGTLQIERLTGTLAPGSGTAMLASTISLSGTANTVVSGVISVASASVQLNAGDRVALKYGGTLTNLTGLCVTIELNIS